MTSPVQNALFRRVRFSSPAQTWSHLTQRRILRRRSHGKAHSALATPPRRDREAHSGRATSRKGAFCVWASPKGALCMRAVVAPRGHFRRSVYTPASPRLPAAAQQCTQMPRNGSESPFSPICVHSCVTTSARSGVTVYTSAPRRRREAIFADLCTLLHSHGRSQRQAEELDEPRLRPVCLFASPYSDPIKRKAF